MTRIDCGRKLCNDNGPNGPRTHVFSPTAAVLHRGECLSLITIPAGRSSDAVFWSTAASSHWQLVWLSQCLAQPQCSLVVQLCTADFSVPHSSSCCQRLSELEVEVEKVIEAGVGGGFKP